MSDWTGLTASGVDDAGACPAKMVFPKYHEPAGDAAERGTALHAFLQGCTVDPSNRAKYLAEVDEEWRHTAVGINLDSVLDGIKVLGCEVAFVLNVKDRTCRKIGENINRDYAQHLKETGQAPLGLYDIPFTVDVLGWSEIADCPVELDYKSGRSIGKVKDHGQRKICTAGLIFHFDTTEAISRVAYIRDDGSVKHDGDEFTMFDAHDICDWAVRIIDKIEEARSNYGNGKTLDVYPNREKQCNYCKSMMYCPYWVSLARSINQICNLESVTIPNLEAVSPEELGKTFDRTKDVLKIFGELEDKLKEVAKKTPLPVDEEYEYRMAQKKGRSYFDASAARGLIVTLLGKVGKDEEEIAEILGSLNKQGKDVEEVRKRKRILPVINDKEQAAE